ncbi:MAG: hypothetical protein Q9170_000502 [Blastenia crenularia]
MSPSDDHARGMGGLEPADEHNKTGEQEYEQGQEREATELHTYNTTPTLELNGSGTHSHRTGGSRALSRSSPDLKTFWKRQVSATVAHEGCRDHFAINLPHSGKKQSWCTTYTIPAGRPRLIFCHAALERTYLSYFRVSLALAFLGVIIAQLFRLQHTQHPDPRFGFFVLGIPLACTCAGAAIVVNLLGTYRFWRQQNAILRGKVLGGGWEVLATFAVVLTMLVLSIFVRICQACLLKEESRAASGEEKSLRVRKIAQDDLEIDNHGIVD